MKSILIITLAIAVVFIGASCADENPYPTSGTQNNNNNGSGSGSGALGEAAPDFNLSSVNGGAASLENYEGKPLVIFFFGSTCPLCIGSAPSVESEINQMYSADDMTIIGIDTWDGNISAVMNFRNTTGVTFDLLLNGSSVESSYGITYDRLLVVDAKGIIAFKGNSSASNTVDEVMAVLDGLIQ